MAWANGILSPDAVFPKEPVHLAVTLWNGFASVDRTHGMLLTGDANPVDHHPTPDFNLH